METILSKTSQLRPIGDDVELFMTPNSIVGVNVVSDNKIETRVVFITPKLAQKILDERNSLNRKVNKKNVNLLSKDMVGGKWKFNGDSIRFNTQGVLSDGQHRLLAIIKSKTTQPIVVINGIDEESFETIDVGFKRSLSDMLSINNIENPILTSQIIKFIYAIRNGKYSANRNTIRNLSNQDAIPYLQTLDNMSNSVEFVKTLSKNKGHQALIGKPVLGGLHYLMSEIDKDKADYFIEKISTGIDLGENSPIIALRNKLIKAKTNNRYKLTNMAMLENVVQSWNYLREGSEVKNIRIKSDFEMILK